MLVQVLQSVAAREGIQLPDNIAVRIADASERNARRAVLMLEAMRVRQYPFADDQQPERADWQRYVATIANDIMTEQSPQRLLKVRNMLYELLGHCVPPSLIMRELCDALLSKCDASLAGSC